SEELMIRGTLDWVLFHRRRDKQCAQPVERAAPTPPRRYQVYEVQIHDADQTDRVREDLLRGTALKDFPLRAITQVEFAAGLPTMTASPEDVRDAWQKLSPGNLLQYALIASNPPGDGDALASQRLSRFTDAVQPVTTFVPEARTDAVT